MNNTLPNYDEKSTSQFSAVKQLINMGYNYLTREEVRDILHKQDYKYLLEEITFQAMRKINDESVSDKSILNRIYEIQKTKFDNGSESASLNIYNNDTIIEYVGLAADEIRRIENFRRIRSHSVKIYPLAEWGMSEQDCLDYCYSCGWNWQENGHELYDILDRVSCWCCTNKNQKEIQNIIKYLPEYWDLIKKYEIRCGIPYKGKGCRFYEKAILSEQ